MAHASHTDTIRVGVIGCGGRGRGAAVDAMNASPNTRIVAFADVFPERLNEARQHVTGHDPSRATVDDENCYTGFDGYKQLLEQSDADYVILATPPHFRPMHFEAAVHAGKHVFMEKPVASDAAGIRTMLAAAEESEKRNLSVIAGTQRRHEACYQRLYEQVQEGAIGDIVSARCWWNQGGLWVVEKQPQWTNMEWMLRNWLYFTWTSGDHIVEQHVHNLDVCNWFLGAHPIKCMGMGGRQVRTEPKYGNIFDHFAVEYEYPDGVIVASQCRQIDGCAGRVAESIRGTKGWTWSASGQAQLQGAERWRFSGENPNPYVVEHQDLVASINGSGKHWNEARQVAESTLTAIMGRMSAYTGQEVSWQQALDSTENLAPETYDWIDVQIPQVAVPGRTPLV
jgi:predicted dehydrogenase